MFDAYGMVRKQPSILAFLGIGDATGLAARPGVEVEEVSVGD